MLRFWVVWINIYVLVSHGIFVPKHSAKGGLFRLSDLGPKRKHVVLHQYMGDSLYGNNVDISDDIPVVYITDFGGDPFGVNDSTNAFIDAIHYATTKYGAPNTTLVNGIKDCGGVTIDLGGGDYKVSKPIVIPSMTGNLRMIHGTIRASETFTPQSSYLLSIGDVNYNCTYKNCNENIGIENMMLDCKNICYGNLHILHVSGSIIGPQIFILGFTNAGITVNEGAETMISNTWIAQYLYTDPNRGKANGTAIQMFCSDSYILNTVIFSGHIGLHINGTADVIQGLHVWGLKGEHDNLIGILIDGYGHFLRFLDCYMDYNDIVFNIWTIFGVNIVNTFFLGGGKLKLNAVDDNTQIHSLTVMNSIYNQGNNNDNLPTIVVNETNGTFILLENTIIYGIQIHGLYQYRSTNAERELTLKNSTKWIFDFSDILVFPGKNIGIQKIDYTISILPSSMNQFVMSNVVKNDTNPRSVAVLTDKPCDATVYIKVAQSKFNPYYPY